MNKINLYAFADEASPVLDEQIKALRRNSLQGLEIRNVDGENISNITKEKALEIKKKMDDASFIIWSLGSPYGKITLEEDFNAHLDKFKHSLEVAHILGAKNIRLFSFFLPAESNFDDYRNEVMERLAKFVEASKGSGITLCHENEKGIYGDIASRCLDIHSSLPELKAVFDPANFVQCCQDTLVAWDVLKKYVHYMHIKDSLLDGNIVPAGLGDGNIQKIANSYIEMGGIHFTMEPHLTVFDGLSNLEQQGHTSQIGQKFVFADNDEAFDAACVAFKSLI